MLQLERFLPSRFQPQLEVSRQILVINGHPDPRPERFCAALCDAYQAGAEQAGWDVQRLDVGSMAMPPSGGVPDLDLALAAMNWATQFLVVFPLWLERPPEGLLRIFLENQARQRSFAASLAADRSLHCIITMEMPAFLHRNARQPETWVEKETALPGFPHQARDYIGSIRTMTPWHREDWLNTLFRHGLEGK